MAGRTSTVKGYRILEKIGKGTYGVVYKVEAVSSSSVSASNRSGKSEKQYYALKEINLSKANAKEKENAKREQETMKCHRHENIVAYKESFFEGSCLYIAMEYCEGGTMFDYLKSKGAGLGEQEFIGFLKQILNGVKYLHMEKIIHRDLKTKNILITKDRKIKIADFGVARSIESNDSAVELSKFVGTVHYMSPEMICANPQYSEKTDIWTLGCTCYEMGTAKYAFDGQNISRIKQSVLRGQLHNVDEMRICEHIKLLILSMLDANPEERPSASFLLETLSAHSCPNTSGGTSQTRAKHLEFVTETIPGSPVGIAHSRQDPLGRSCTNASLPRESPRDRRRQRNSLSRSEDEISLRSSLSRLSFSSADSSTENSASGDRGSVKRMLRRYKDQAKTIQNNLALTFNDYDAHQWVVEIRRWCKTDSIEDVERKAKDLLQQKRNLYRMSRCMIRALKETEDGIKEIEQMRGQNDLSTDGNTSDAASTITN